jgi:hypothetical protein
MSVHVRKIPRPLRCQRQLEGISDSDSDSGSGIGSVKRPFHFLLLLFAIHTLNH